MCIQKPINISKIKLLLAYQKNFQIFGDYIKISKGRIKTYAAIEMFKTEKQCKTPQVVGAMDGTEIFINAPILESLHDYYWRRQIYSINVEAVEG